MIKIRNVKEEDWKGINELYNEWRTENTFSVPEKTLNKSQAKKRTKQLIKEGLNLIAEDNKQVLGLIESGIGMLPKIKHTLYINQLNVRKTKRKLGIATKLMNELIKIAEKKKIKMIFLHVVSTNKPAIKFYEKQGFKITGKIIKQYKFDNKYIDNNIMCKLI